MARARVQVQETMEGTDTELSELCDNLLSAREETESYRKEEQAIEAKLIEVMSASGKKSIKHNGKTIRLVHQEEKNKIQVQSQ